MTRTRHPGQEALHQPPHHVGRSAQLQRPRLLLPLREHLHEQRQGERVAMRDLEHPPLVLLRHARATQEGPRLVRPEVAHGDHAQQVSPPRIPPPRRPGTVPARHHDQRPSRERRDELLPQPVLEPDRGLERVQQQHCRCVAGKRLPRRRLCAEPERPPKLGHERRWRGLDGSQIEAHDPQACILGRLGERAEQHGLANSAGAV
jgi:hypothetical protein